MANDRKRDEAASQAEAASQNQQTTGNERGGPGRAGGRQGREKLNRVAVLINPAAGRDRPILAPLNRALEASGLEWEAFVLRRDATQSAVESALASRPDALWVYGGDGTVAHVATALLDSPSPHPALGVLPGGTANAFAETLGAPADPEEALRQLCEGQHAERQVDVGVIDGRTFLLRVSIGATAGLTSNTTREEKDRLGLFAYVLSGLRALSDTRPQVFRIDVDGNQSEHEGVSVVVANAGGTGVGSALASNVSSSDRRLDVLIVPSARWVARVLANVSTGEGLMDGCTRLRGQRIRVESQDPVDVHFDGEPGGTTPVNVSLRTDSLSVLRYAEADPDSGGDRELDGR